MTKPRISWLKITRYHPTTQSLSALSHIKWKNTNITYIPRSGNSLNPTVNPKNCAKIKSDKHLTAERVAIFVSICGVPRSHADSEADEFCKGGSRIEFPKEKKKKKPYEIRIFLFLLGKRELCYNSRKRVEFLKNI